MGSHKNVERASFEMSHITSHNCTNKECEVFEAVLLGSFSPLISGIYGARNCFAQCSLIICRAWTAVIVSAIAVLDDERNRVGVRYYAQEPVDWHCKYGEVGGHLQV